jgi:hypothetical protein
LQGVKLCLINGEGEGVDCGHHVSPMETNITQQSIPCKRIDF